MKNTLAICLVMLACGADAFQTFDVKNGSEVTATVYKSGLSRIYLQDDRISAIKAMAGEFQIDKNDEIGDIYIKPLTARSSDELDLFIQSERGNTYALRLKVSADKPESIRLDAHDLVDKKSETMTAPSYDEQSEIIELIKLVSQGHEIKGYNTEVFAEPSRLKLKQHVFSILQKTYEGKKYRIEVLRIENNTDKHITIDERDLAQISNVAAVSLETGTLAENEGTKAYRVVRL